MISSAHVRLGSLIVGLLAAGGATLTAQGPRVPAQGANPVVQAEPHVLPDWKDPAWRRDVVRVGQDYTLRAGERVRSVVVVAGTLRLEGEVLGDVVLLGGSLTLTESARIGGSLTMLGGAARIDETAMIDGDLIVIGGDFDAPPGFSPMGQYIVLGPRTIGGRLDALLPWITHGLLWARVLVPSIGWMWRVVIIVFLAYLALSLLGGRAVRASADTLGAKPVTAFLVGLLVMLLAIPVCLLLVVSLVGIVVAPFVLCALIVAWFVGRVGVMRWIGRTAVAEDASPTVPQSIRSFTFGFAILVVAYMIPIVGVLAWGLTGVFGLGAATLAFLSSYRGENPSRPRARERSQPSAVAMPALPSAAAIRSGATPDDPTPSRAFEAPPSAPSFATSLDTVEALAPGVADTTETATAPRADFKSRLAGAVLDLFLVLIVAALLEPIVRLNDTVRGLLIALLVYNVAFWTWKGTTIGGIICQLRLVRDDGHPVTFGDALIRGLAAVFSVAVAGIGFLWMLRDPERQTWHDRIAGTYVLKVPRRPLA